MKKNSIKTCIFTVSFCGGIFANMLSSLFAQERNLYILNLLAFSIGAKINDAVTIFDGQMAQAPGL